MSMKYATSTRDVSSSPSKPTHTHLHGYWLVLARVVWIALVTFVIGLFVIGLPEYVAQLYTEGTNLVYIPWQLSPEGFLALQHAGISLSVYAPVVLVLSSAILFVWVGSVS